jgi:hypothetical protein
MARQMLPRMRVGSVEVEVCSVHFSQISITMHQQDGTYLFFLPL